MRLGLGLGWGRVGDRVGDRVMLGLGGELKRLGGQV